MTTDLPGRHRRLLPATPLVVRLALAAVTTITALGGAGATTARADDASTRNVAGSVQLDYLAVPTDRHARDTTLDGPTIELSLKYTRDITKDVTASVKVCFACHGFEAGAAYVELRVADELRFRVGRMTPAFGAFPLRHDPANHQTSDKPLPYDMGRMIRRVEWNEGILPAPWVDNGVEASGTHFWDGGQLDYAVYAMGGPKSGPQATDFDFTLSRSSAQYYVDNNSQPTVGGRISTTLDLDDDDATLALGASAMAGRYDPARTLGFAMGGVDAVLSLGGVFLRAEYLLRATQLYVGPDPQTQFKYGPGANGRYADYFLKDGFYVEGELPIGRLSVLARWDGLRRVGNVLASEPLSSAASVLRYTGGLAYKLGAGVRLKASGEYYQFSDFANEVALHLGVAMPF
jgi:hypothetical protein